MTVINPLNDGDIYWSAFYNAHANAFGAGGIISGCSISKGTGDWDIDVTSGQIIEANTEGSISSGTVTITDSSGLSTDEERITLIHADTGDTLASTDGAAASSPSTPDIPAGEVLLGFVHVENGDSTVADSDIFDVPALLQNDSTRYEDGGSHEIDAADFAAGAGSSNQFLRSDGSAASWTAPSQAEWTTRSDSSNASGTHETHSVVGYVVDWYVTLTKSGTSGSDDNGTATIKFTWSDDSTTNKSASRANGDSNGTSTTAGDASELTPEAYNQTVKQIDFEFDSTVNDGSIDYEWGFIVVKA